jgi:N-methylhydantoinase A
MKSLHFLTKNNILADVGGTFTDLLLLDHEGNIAAKAKTPSTPADPSEGISNGITKVCEKANIQMSQIKSVFHGTTVATNAILEGKGSKCALIVTRGYRQVLHIDRSFVPGGLGGWITWNPTPPLAPLEATFEVGGQ